jgi:hypothetical protein
LCVFQTISTGEITIRCFEENDFLWVYEDFESIFRVLEFFYLYGMGRNVFLYIIISCFSITPVVAQQNNDTAFIISFVDNKLKEFDLRFKKSYPIYKYSKIHYAYLQVNDSLFPDYLIGKKLNWEDYNLKTKFGYITDNYKGKDTCLYVIAPRVNADTTKFYIKFILDFKGVSYWNKYYFIKNRKRWHFDYENKGVSY